MRARDFIYHVDCFRCVACNRPLTAGEEFALRDDVLLCRADYDAVDRGGGSDEQEDSIVDVAASLLGSSAGAEKILHNNNNNNNDEMKDSALTGETKKWCLNLFAYINI